MNKLFTKISVSTLLLFATALSAGGDTAAQQQDQARARYQAMIEDAEQARANAESARREAVSASEMAREMARESARAVAESRHEKAELSRQESDELARERAIKQEELAHAREELSKTHRELREATRVVAQAHRELSREGKIHQEIRHINLGDRAVIGIVIGRQSEKGVPIIGVSPDGPAERAGLEQGDTIVSIRGVGLAGNGDARQSVFRVMGEVEDGEEITVQVDRAGQTGEYTVIAERREPRVWQSVIRIPEIDSVAEVHEVDQISAVDGSRHVIIERIELPEIDEETLKTQIAELTEHIKTEQFLYINTDGEDGEGWEIEEFSSFGRGAMDEADLWFGLPRAHGLELASINEGLGSYFKTDRGVLVIKAKEGNAYQLESGDVILTIGSTSVSSPADMMRALRDAEAGDEVEIEIKRNRKDKTLIVVVPENRLGYR